MDEKLYKVQLGKIHPTYTRMTLQQFERVKADRDKLLARVEAKGYNLTQRDRDTLSTTIVQEEDELI